MPQPARHIRVACRACLVAAIVAAPLALVPAPAATQEMPAPVETQVTLLTRILQFDRGFDARAGEEIVVVVLYQSRFRASLNAHDEVVRLLEAHGAIGGKPIRVVSHEVCPGTPPGPALEALGATVAYVTPLRATGVASILSATRELRILTSTGVPEYVDDGISVVAAPRSERAEILINLDSSVAEGARFSSELLKLSRVIQAGEPH